MMDFLVAHALESSLAAAGFGLLASFGLIAWIRNQPDGNDRMREVAAAIQEGAAAYLNRQLQAISLIALLLFGAIVWLKNLPTGAGFLIGAACSLAAGFFGMRIAVMA
ncbi:MAG: sodium-translocating pyrophosphatase, partial [Verrucomicrobia bacterium]|nr:sodium-translocating pyrophosphatase [Verrucomicrobiota bacterium]